MRTILALCMVLLMPPSMAWQRSNVVTDARTGAPLGSSKVLFARVDGRLLDSLVIETDGQGRFVAVGVPGGTYRLFAEHDGYLRGEWAEPVTVRVGEALTGVTIALTPTAVITGRVLDALGDPARRVYVRAVRPSGNYADLVPVAETRTNDLGEYRLFGLPPGSYFVSALPSDLPQLGANNIYHVPQPPCPNCRTGAESSISVSLMLRDGAFIDPGALAGATYPRLYFPDTTDFSSARVIEAEPGSEVTAIDFRLIVRERGR